MSFQAYLDNIEAKTGKTPNEFIELARAKGYDQPDVKAGVIVAWLKEEFGLGRGHAMALVYVIKNGPEIGDKHVGTTGSHRDPSNTLKLDGKDSAPGERHRSGSDSIPVPSSDPNPLATPGKPGRRSGLEQGRARRAAVRPRQCAPPTDPLPLATP